MTNEMKAAFRLGLLVLALILTGLSIMFIHDEAGNTIFITSVQNWQYVDWTPTIIEIAVIWVVYGILRFSLLRTGTSGVPKRGT